LQEQHRGQPQQQPQQQTQQHGGWQRRQVLGPQQQTSHAAAAAAASPALQQQQISATQPRQAPAAATTAPGATAGTESGSGPQALGVLVLVFGGVVALAREVADAAGAAYSETLLPAATLLWQLAAAVGSLLSVVVVYLLLPLLKTATVLLQRLLQGAGHLLQRLKLQQNDDDEDLGSRLFFYPHQQRLLASARRQLAAACSATGKARAYVTADDAFWYTASYFASKARIDAGAGYGTLAFEGGPEAAPEAVQLYILKDEQDVAGFCAAVRACLGLRHSQLLQCIGAAVDIVPARSLLGDAAGCRPDASLQAQIAAAVGDVHKQGLETAMVVVGCLMMELLQQPASLAAGLQAAATLTSIDNRPSVAAVAAPAPRCLTKWSSRLQLAPRLVAGLQYFDQQLAQLPPSAQPTSTTAAAAAAAGPSWFSRLTAERLAAAVVLDAAAMPPWLKLNPALLLLGQQQQQQRHLHAVHVLMDDTGTAAAAGAYGLAHALADVLLMLLSGASSSSNSTKSTSSTSSSAATSQRRSAEQLQQVLARSRQAAELMSAAEQAALDSAGLQIIQQVLQEVAGILAWQQVASSQQHEQQQQRPAGGIPARTNATFSVAAAEVMHDAEDAAQQDLGGQHNSQQHQVVTPAGAMQNSSAAATPRSGWLHGWWGRQRTMQQQQQVSVSMTDTTSSSGSSRTAGDAGSSSRTAASVYPPAAQPPAAAAHGFDWSHLLHRLQQLADQAAAWQQQQHRKPAKPRSREPPAYFICPVTAAVMKDPVVAADGFTYERSAITRWLQQQGMRRSPMTNKPMETLLVPNHSLRSSIMEWHEQQQQRQQ
jgi:hypothetical protein